MQSMEAIRCARKINYQITRNDIAMHPRLTTLITYDCIQYDTISPTEGHKHIHIHKKHIYETIRVYIYIYIFMMAGN